MEPTVESPERRKEMLLLPQEWRDFLLAAGETGVGYQTGDVTLKDGTVFRDVGFGIAYLGGIRGRKTGDIPFSAEDIAKIEITHNKWQWDWE